MRRSRPHGYWRGNVVLLAALAALVLRPWEAGGGSRDDGPAAATAPVTRVVDGDTFEARVAGKVEDVRLIGVDTPETVKPDTPVQCFGPQASNFTHHLLEGRQVRLVFGEERRDIYGRLLAYVHLEPAGRPATGARRPAFVNAMLVRRGLARSLTIPPNDRFAPLFRRLELRAARSGRGLWGACRP
jgi:micrococcal nuclease